MQVLYSLRISRDVLQSQIKRLCQNTLYLTAVKKTEQQPNFKVTYGIADCDEVPSKAISFYFFLNNVFMLAFRQQMFYITEAEIFH